MYVSARWVPLAASWRAHAAPILGWFHDVSYLYVDF